MTITILPQTSQKISVSRMLMYPAKMCASALCLASSRCSLLLSLLVLSTVIPDSAQMESCRLRLTEYEVRYRDCEPKTTIALGCSGGCYSYTQPDPTNPFNLQTSCKCCRELGRQRGRIILKCPDPSDPQSTAYLSVGLSLPRRCVCRPCSDD